MNEHGSPLGGPVTIDHHIHYVASSGQCRPSVVIDPGDGETIAFLLALVTPDEVYTIWHADCQHDEATKMPDTWHAADCGEFAQTDGGQSLDVVSGSVTVLSADAQWSYTGASS